MRDWSHMSLLGLGAEDLQAGVRTLFSLGNARCCHRILNEAGLFLGMFRKQTLQVRCRV